MIRYALSALWMMLALPVWSQPGFSANQTDAKGKRQGPWFIEQPARRGEEAFSEWGNYDHGLRTGTWYRFDGDGDIKSIEHYRLGALDGEAKYFENGHLACVGQYRGLNPFRDYDTIYVLDPVKDIEYKRVIPTERGTVKHGYWRYYDENTGRLTREIFYIIDEAVLRRDFAVAPVDSAYYRRREANLPHNQKHFYEPPKDKQFNYTDFH